MASLAVRNNTGVAPPPWRKRRRSVSPSTPGSHQSSRTTSHDSVCSRCQPSWPSAACSTVKPSSRSPRARKSAISASSSMTRMRMPMRSRSVLFVFLFFLLALRLCLGDLATGVEDDLDRLLAGGDQQHLVTGHLVVLAEFLDLLDGRLGIL